MTAGQVFREVCWTQDQACVVGVHPDTLARPVADWSPRAALLSRLDGAASSSSPITTLVLRTMGSAEGRSCKAQIQTAASVACPSPLPNGPVTLTLRFGVSGARNWSTLWKPAIDARGPVLGSADPAKAFHPTTTASCNWRCTDASMTSSAMT
jgi:hypothetical protein